MFLWACYGAAPVLPAQSVAFIRDLHSPGTGSYFGSTGGNVNLIQAVGSSREAHSLALPGSRAGAD